MSPLAEKLMIIYDTFATKDDRVVVAGTDPRFDALSLAEIEQIIGSTVSINSTTFSVLGIDVSQSLIGRKNIFLKLNASFDSTECLLGSEVLRSNSGGNTGREMISGNPTLWSKLVD